MEKTQKKYDVAVAVKEKQAGKPENWYVCHIQVDGAPWIGSFAAGQVAVEKLRETYKDQADAELLGIQILEAV